jgi:hypothetical protein
MSFISGLGRPDYTIPVQRTTAASTASPADDFLSLNDCQDDGQYAEPERGATDADDGHL